MALNLSLTFLEMCDAFFRNMFSLQDLIGIYFVLCFYCFLVFSLPKKVKITKRTSSVLRKIIYLVLFFLF